MSHSISDEQLWSWIDLRAPELDRHLADHPSDLERVDALRGVMHTARASDVASAPPLPARIGSYSILGRLGQGGMGLVFEAEQDNPRRKVALKVIRGGALGDARRVALFRREIEALGRLVHPAIATIYEAGETESGEPFYSMELVRGTPLTVYARERDLPRRERLELLARVALAVQHAHEQGVIHRDLKPSNVLVDPLLGPKILDFGLARVTDPEGSLTDASLASGVLAGTLAYMSPEQARGASRATDARTDVYALGVMLYELLTDRLPHDLARRALPEAVRILCDMPPRRISSIDASLRGDLATIVEKALEKDASRRYASAADLAEDLRRFLAGEPIRARRASRGYRLRKWCARHRLFVVASALISFAGAWGLYNSVAGADFSREVTGHWFKRGFPFSHLAWKADTPFVEIDGRELELFSIQGLRAGLIVESCKQSAPHTWRKRFSEDLVEGLWNLGKWSLWSVDVEVRDPESGSVRRIERVPLSDANRRAVWTERHAWPFDAMEVVGKSMFVRCGARRWALRSIDGIDAGRLLRSLPVDPRTQDAIVWELYDALADLSGRSPGEMIELVVVDARTHEPISLGKIRRAMSDEGKRALWASIEGASTPVESR